MTLCCLTLHPEHVELFRLGLRWIETRGWATKHRGPIGLHASVRDPDSSAARRDPISRAALDAIPHGDPLTRGAIVVTAQLVDCVPMVGEDGDLTEREPPCLEIRPPGGVNAGLWLWPPAEDLTADGPQDVSDQRPYGLFAPGRVAWLLEDIKPTTERCPGCWGRGWTDHDNGVHSVACRTCERAGTCDPIPAKGRQGPWTWDPTHDESETT